MATALGGCALSDTTAETVTHTRADGEAVVCNRPPEAWLDTERAAALSASFPDLVQALLDTGSAERKVPTLLRAASTPELFGILTYRVCLAYGEGVITGPAYEQWLHDVRPVLARHVHADTT